MPLFSSIEVSVVVPFYNEKGNIEQLVKHIHIALKDIGFELILVNDGSTDSEHLNLSELQSSNTKIITLNKNYGQSTAIKAGFDSSRGKIIALIDADLQNNPNDLVAMLALLENTKADMIQGYRRQRMDGAGKRLPSMIANKMIKLLFNINCNDIGCSLKVFHRNVLTGMIYFNGFHRYIPLIAHLKNHKVIEQEVDHRARHAGNSKYGIGRIFPVLYHLFMLKFNAGKLAQNLNYSIAGPANNGQVLLC